MNSGYHTKMNDDLSEMLIYLRCNGT